MAVTYSDSFTARFAYDIRGNTIQMIDRVGTSTYTFDPLNRMTGCTDPFGKTVGYDYDANGNRTNLIYPEFLAVALTQISKSLM